MMNNNHKNSDCGFSEELVSYLYGETDAAENTEFEAHLKSCSVCADELEAFSGVHFSINDWKLKEFANLETPVIEIPYEKTEKAPDKQEVSTVTGSWVSGLRNLISLSPAWSLGAASFAVLAIVVGVALLALNSPKVKDNEVAARNKPVKPTATPSVEKTSEQTNTNNNKTNSPDKDVKPINEPKRPQPEVADTTGTNPKSNQTVKVVNTQRQVQKVDNPNTPKTADANRKKNNDPKLGPKVAPEDEDEDKSLRLAEIFDEIETK